MSKAMRDSIQSYPAGFVLPSEGLHEFYAAAHADAACLSGCALMLGRAAKPTPYLWVRHGDGDREVGSPCPAGLRELNTDPAQAILVLSRDPASALQAALEGARTPHLGAVIVELWGEAPAYDLTASRRIALAAKTSGVLVLMMRTAATPTPSAAETRWRVCAAPSRALAAQSPGHPAFEMTLLRARNGREGLRYCVEWDRDAGQFISRIQRDAGIPVRGFPSSGHSALSGALVPVSFDRSGTSPIPPRRQAG
jgi:protein ImuA